MLVQLLALAQVQVQVQVPVQMRLQHRRPRRGWRCRCEPASSLHCTPCSASRTRSPQPMRLMRRRAVRRHLPVTLSLMEVRVRSNPVAMPVPVPVPVHMPCSLLLCAPQSCGLSSTTTPAWVTPPTPRNCPWRSSVACAVMHASLPVVAAAPSSTSPSPTSMSCSSRLLATFPAPPEAPTRASARCGLHTRTRLAGWLATAPHTRPLPQVLRVSLHRVVPPQEAGLLRLSLGAAPDRRGAVLAVLRRGLGGHPERCHACVPGHAPDGVRTPAAHR